MWPTTWLFTEEVDLHYTCWHFLLTQNQLWTALNFNLHLLSQLGTGAPLTGLGWLYNKYRHGPGPCGSVGAASAWALKGFRSDSGGGELRQPLFLSLQKQTQNQ